jgi:NAD(P)-dependent dehydrogenase (short-subunit alcohol dehydrogenase family)
MRDLEGKVAVVTGGASGIGRALATACRDAGMRVVIADVEEHALRRAARELGVTGMLCDVSDAWSVQALADDVQEQFGTCHLLCNNAGVGGGGRFEELTLNDWRWVLGVNLWGVIHGLQSFLPLLRANPDGGHVVNTASLAGLSPLPGAAPYAASKYAVVGISETLREELAGTPVGVSVLCPGFVRTNIFTSQRNRPDDLRNDEPKVEARTANEGIIRVVMETAIDPSDVATHVLDAVRDGRFWVITHPEMLAGVLERRRELDDLAAGA